MAARKRMIIFEYDQVVFMRNCNKQESNKKARSPKRPGFFIGVIQMKRKRSVSDEIINECVFDQIHCGFIR
jgi:hypothetical protein